MTFHANPHATRILSPGWAVAVLALLGFFLAMDVSLTILLIEPMKRELGLSDLQIGLIQGTAYGLALGFSSLPLGRLVDRAPRTQLIMIGLAVWIVVMTTMALVSSTVTIVLARMALGMTGALLVPAGFSMMADVCPPDRRAVATSVLVIGQAGGQAVGVLAGGLAFDALTRLAAAHPALMMGLSPWRLLYLAGALAGLLLIAIFNTLAEPARQEQREPDAPTATALREVWERRGFIGPLLMALLFSQVTAQAASIWTPSILIRSFHSTPGQFAGWLSAVMLGGGIAGSFGAGRLGAAGFARFGRAGVLAPAAAAAVAIAPFSLFGLAPGIPLFGGLLGLHILAGAMAATLGAAAITLLIPNEIRGLTLGLNAFVTAVFGAAIAPPAIAWLSARIGGEDHIGAAVTAVCVPSALLSALCFVWAMRSADGKLSLRAEP